MNPSSLESTSLAEQGTQEAVFKAYLTSTSQTKQALWIKDHTSGCGLFPKEEMLQIHWDFPRLCRHRPIKTSKEAARVVKLLSQDSFYNSHSTKATCPGVINYHPFFCFSEIQFCHQKSQREEAKYRSLSFAIRKQSKPWRNFDSDDHLLTDIPLIKINFVFFDISSFPIKC